MITITARRNNGWECPPIVYDKSVEDALISLLKYELGFGGKVIELSETKIVTRTQILGCVDTTEFEGSKEEMRHLIVAVALYYDTFAIAKPQIQEETWETLQKNDWN